jgi:peptidoglycan/xylan/chitin deacetylase (PgdA/CDA1 family)
MIVMFHYVFDETDRSASIYHPRYYCSREKLSYVTNKYLRMGKKFVTYRDYSKIIRTDPKAKDKLVCYTFDDATMDHFNVVAPTLNDLGVTASFYSITKYLELQNPETLPIHQYQIASSLVHDEGMFAEKLFNLIKYKFGVEAVDKWARKFAGWAGLDNYDVLLTKRILEVELSESQSHKLICSALDFMDAALKNKFYKISQKFYCGKHALKEMYNAGFEVGSHSHSHKWLGQLSEDDAWNDIYESINMLRHIDVLDKEWTVCYPHGNWNTELLRKLEMRDDCVGGVVIDDVTPSVDLKYLTEPRVDISILDGEM